MQYIALLALVASMVSAQESTDEQLTDLLADVKSHLSDYLGEIADGNSPPAALLSLVQEAETYTDDSYTTLYSLVDMAEVTSYVTGLPWYSSRLESIIGAAATTSAAESSTAETTAAESSAAETTAAASSSAAETTAAASSSAAETTVAVESSSAATSAATTAVETVNEENGAMAYAPLAFAALVPLALL